MPQLTLWARVSCGRPRPQILNYGRQTLRSAWPRRHSYAPRPGTVSSPRHRTIAVVFLFLALLTSTASAQEHLTIEVTGVEGDVAQNVKAFLSIEQLQPKPVGLLDSLPFLGNEEQEEKPFSADDVQRLHTRAEGEIRQALRPYGYYSPTIRVRLDRINGGWLARYDIDPGPATIVRTLDLSVEGAGRDDPGIAETLAGIKLRQGQRLIHSQYEETKKALVTAANNAGYLDARFARSEMLVSPAKQRAELFLRLETGDRYFFGPITVEQDILDPEFVARFLSAEPGQPFDSRRLLTSQIALSSSGYFSLVEIQIRRDMTEDFRVPVSIDTRPAKSQRYATGFGFGTDTGPRVSLAMEQRRINRRGHSLLTDLRFSKIKTSLGTQYKIPIRNVETDRFVISATAESENVSDDGNTDRYKLGGSINDGWGAFRRSVYANFQFENFSIGDDDDSVTYLIPGASLSQIRADNAVFPRRGISWTVDVRGAMQQVISETSFIRPSADVRLVLPLGKRARLLARGQVGVIAVEDFGKLPLTERYFAGGDRSVRGYGYQRLGPTDDSGEVVGGRYLGVASAEVDYLFIGNFGLAAFVDAGNADDNFPPDPRVGAGLGLRWRSPVGMLRIDFAHPFIDSDDRYRLHISIGPSL
ncbi:MAG: autotransporter assembly complex family protein [Gammaproteobacteria bacterium]